MKALLVKTSSLGDLLHTMPAISDAFNQVPGLELDWIIEETLAPIGHWHGKVGSVIPVAMRRWRQAALRGQIRSVAREIRALRRKLAETRYDAVIDAQGLYKSAVVTRMANGPRFGFSRASVREPLAALAYNRTADVPREINIILRNRRLFASVFGYEVPATAADFGISAEKFVAPRISGPYILFLHSASWRTKLWPVAHWRSLARLADDAGYAVCLAWHSADERRRAEEIGEGLPNTLASQIDLSTVGGLIAHSDAVISVETGFAHLAAALGRPTVTFYGPTGRTRHGTTGPATAEFTAALPCSPCYSRRCKLLRDGAGDSPCMVEIGPDSVWITAARLIADASDIDMSRSAPITRSASQSEA